MTLKLSSDQQELQSSIRRFLEDQCTSDYVRKRFEGRAYHDGTLLSALQELGLTSYFSEPGARFRDLALIAFECGRVLLPESLIDATFSGAFLFANLIGADSRASTDKLLSRKVLSEIAAGKSSIAVVPPNYSQKCDIAWRSPGELQRINCEFRFVAGADTPNFLIFAHKGAVYLSDLYTGKEQRCEVTEENTVDRTERRFKMVLGNVATVKLDLKPELLVDLINCLKACELAGIMAKVVEMTVEYSKTRKQFDSPIGGFQAVQHKLADMHLHAEATRSLSDFASWSADHSREQLSLAAGSAISYATDHAPIVVENAIQLHGGIGFTWEHNLHFYLRRAKTIEMLYGIEPKSLLEVAINN